MYLVGKFYKKKCDGILTYQLILEAFWNPGLFRLQYVNKLAWTILFSVLIKFSFP